MNAVSLGPLVLAADRFAVVLAIFVFLIVTVAIDNTTLCHHDKLRVQAEWLTWGNAG